MSIFYLEVEGGTIYSMNATTSITRNSDGALSNSLTEDGVYRSDNYVVRPVVLSFSGIITDISTFSGTNFDIKPEQYLNGLKRAQINKTPIRVFYSDIQPPDSNCYFTSFSHKQDLDQGRAGNGLNAFNVNFTLQKTRFAQGATSVAKPSSVVEASVATKSKKGSSTSKVGAPQFNSLVVNGTIDGVIGGIKDSDASAP
jgi:hypothetical protein